MHDIDSILRRIHVYASGKHGNKARLTRESGVPASVLSLAGRADWNPTVDTVRKLDAAVKKFTAAETAPTSEQPQD